MQQPRTNSFSDRPSSSSFGSHRLQSTACYHLQPDVTYSPTGRLISSPRRHIASSEDVKNGHYSYWIFQTSDTFHFIVIDIDYLNIPTFYYFSRNTRNTISLIICRFSSYICFSHWCFHVCVFDFLHRMY